MVPYFDERHISNTIWALTKLRVVGRQGALLEALLAKALECARDFTAQNICNILLHFVRMMDELNMQFRDIGAMAGGLSIAFTIDALAEQALTRIGDFTAHELVGMLRCVKKFRYADSSE